jgi:hypothetical protein
MRQLTPTLAIATVVAAITCGAANPATLGAPVRHAYGSHPEIINVTNFTGVSGGPVFPVHFDYVDAGCKVVGGTWTDQFDLVHPFSIGPNDACHAGVGSLTPGWGICTGPNGELGQPGAYPQTLVLRDEKGNLSPPFAFFIVCLAP